jgi:hypothetical protein
LRDTRTHHAPDRVPRFDRFCRAIVAIATFAPAVIRTAIALGWPIWPLLCFFASHTTGIPTVSPHRRLDC